MIAERELSSRRGQSIIEALVALSILVVGLMGVLALLSQSLSLQRTTEDELKATYLAAEGVEIAKSLIDHNVYYGAYEVPGVDEETAGWAGSLANTCFGLSSGYYYLDINNVACPVSSSGSSEPEPLDFSLTNAATGEGQYYDANDAPAGSEKTDFARVVKVTRPDVNTIDVVSTVTWTTGAAALQTLTLEDTFYNWHP